jgi:(2Fe-2S) ferredoxin
MRGDAIYVCMPNDGTCPCGNVSLGSPAIAFGAWIEHWATCPAAMHLALVLCKCLGPCAFGNVVLIRAHGACTWLRGVQPADIANVMDLACALVNKANVGGSFVREKSFAHPDFNVA